MLGAVPERPVRLLARLICLAWSPLVLGQGAPGLSPAAQLFDRSLRELKGTQLLVLDGPKGEWKAKVDALPADLDWVELDVSCRYYGSKATEIHTLLQQRFSLGAVPQWVLVGTGGQLVASGGTAPEPKSLAGVVAQSGLRSELQILRDFTRRNPEHLGGREALCFKLKAKAAQKTKVRFQDKLDPIQPADERFDVAKFLKERDEKEEAKAREAAEDKPIALLKSEEDQSIWGELADAVSRSFRLGDWLEMEPWALVPDETAVHSPLMQDLSRGAVLEVERALGRNPASWRLWTLWLGLTRTFGGKPIRPLLDSLTPLPNQPPGSWPPSAVREAYVKDARARKDWEGIRDLLLPQVEASRLWEATQGTFTFQWKLDGRVLEDPETGDAWRSTMEPLTEALLRLGDTDRADDLVRYQFGRHPWSGLPARASALAIRCNQPSLAAQWAALGAGR